MHKRTLKVALLVTLAIIMVLGITSFALASSWKDLPDTVTGKYQITDDQVAQISDGFANGLWKPYINVTREQFVKMADAAFKIPLANPATATYTDVAKGSLYYQYIEGATAAGMTNGFGGATFNPTAPITREQAIAIVVRWVAKANGYTLATQYTAAQITALLAPFSDAAAVNLKPEMAFAIDFGITVGNAYGKLAPASNMTRIQGAAFLIRATNMVPAVPVKASKIAIVGSDKTENLIGQNHSVTFQATKADGTPAVGVLVDFDTLTGGGMFVGNIEPQAAMTDKFGDVTVNLNSSEPGTEQVSASVPGLAAAITTKYWLVLDEVYTVAGNNGLVSQDGSALPVVNNAGTTHDWTARVVVFGPGPRSTSPQDWYNAISTAPFDPTNIQPTDGINVRGYLTSSGDDWTWKTEQLLAADGYAPRTLPGVTVNWSILGAIAPTVTISAPPVGGTQAVATAVVSGGQVVGFAITNPGNGYVSAPTVTISLPFFPGTRATAMATIDGLGRVTAITPVIMGSGYFSGASVGTIKAITNSGTIATNGLTASGPTDASGASTITITSQVTGVTNTQAVAGYAGNPYPNLLYNHGDDVYNFVRFTDWDPQPAFAAMQSKTWIPHTLPVSSGPLTMASSKDNTGEDELVTLTLTDIYGNAIPGYQVEWTLQGVGVLKNAQLVTDATGKATATLYSSEPGQSIVETKVLDKSGLPAYVYTATKQWYEIDSVAFINPATGAPITSTVFNPVNTPDTFTVQVSGVKWVWTSTDINGNGLPDDQAMVISRDSAYAIAGRIINEDGTLGAAKPANTDLPVQTVMRINASPDDSSSPYIYVTRFADATLLTGEMWGFAPGGDNDADDPLVVWSALAGKGIDFFNNIGSGGTPTSNTTIPTVPGAGTDDMPLYVGTITGSTAPWTDVTYGGTKYHYDAVTDAKGEATVTVNSTVKGDQFVYAVADYPGNPQSSGATNASTPLNWSQLLFASVHKVWEPNTTGTASVSVFGVSHAISDTNLTTVGGVIVKGNSYTDPIEPFAGYTTTGVAAVNIAAPPAGTAPTGITATVAGGAVTFTGTALPLGSGYTAADTASGGQAVTAFLQGGGAAATAFLGTTLLTSNEVVSILVTNGGTGYTVAPIVNITAPDIAGGTQATATANISGGNVVSITVTNIGSGYTSAPTITFTSENTAAVTIGHITGVNGTNQVSALTGLTGLSYPNGAGYVVTVPAPIKVRAEATATVLGGVVTALNLVAFDGYTGGAGYITPPAVIISPSDGAAAHATVNTDSSVALVLDSGGTGFTGPTTEPATVNPNRETLAVQVFDQYGNALPDYKVVWQIVQQGTTTSGTVPTYHPYAHFENVFHGYTEDALTASQTDGIGDTNSHVKINPIWNGGSLGTSDDDLAWGYTLNSATNFDAGLTSTQMLASAAHVDLVLDDALSVDAYAPGTEFSDIVNVTVYTPTGATFDQFTQIKNWVVPPVPVTQVSLLLSANATGPWALSLTTSNANYYVLVQTGDASWNPAPGHVYIKVAGPQAANINVGTVNGIVTGAELSPTLAGTYTLTAYVDLDASGTLTAGDIVGTPATLIVP